MEEIALVFSSLAGACTAVAMDKIPRRKARQTLTVSTAVENQLHSLRIEKEILTKTITRLHNDESGISKIQRDKLLMRYQHQLGAITAKIEKLEVASRYPDLGPVGDSLVTLMDSKLSKLDQRLNEISSKITAGTMQQAVQTEKPSDKVQAPQVQKVEQAKEPPRQLVQERPREEKPEPEIKAPQQVFEIPKEKIPEPVVASVHLPEKHVSVELSTLTTIPSKMPEFPPEFIKPATIEPPKAVEVPKEVEAPQLIVPVEPTPLVIKEEPPLVEVPSPVVEIPKISEMPKPEAEAPKPEPVAEKKPHLPTPIRIPEEEEKIEDDDKDLDKIKSEIMKALSKLEQVEVE